MASRTQYTDEFRSSVILMLEAAGYPDQKGSLSRVAKETKVPYQTLSRWFRAIQNPPPPEMVQKKRIDLVESLTDMLGLHIVAGTETIQHAHHGQVMTGIGILIDKLQLLTGGATSNENHNVKIQYADDNDN